jgi:hypothetical protein
LAGSVALVVVAMAAITDLYPRQHSIVEMGQHGADDEEPARLEKRDGFHPILRI